MHCPLVTTFIPSFNHAQYVAKCVRSALDQTYPNFEVIVIDDGSSDDSHNVLQTFRRDPRITLILNKNNRGQSAVFNQALRIARGEFIAYLPSDDWHLPEKTSLQVARFQELPDSVGVVYGRGFRYFEDTGKTAEVNLPMHRGWVLNRLLEDGNFVSPATPMFRRSCFDEVKLDESYRAEGEAIYLKLALHYAFEFVDAHVAVMRDHQYNTGKDIRMMYEDNLRYWMEFFSREDVPEDLRDLRSRRIASVHRTKGLQFIRALGDRVAGRSALLKAIAMYPPFASDWRVLTGLAITLLPSYVVQKLRKDANRYAQSE